MDIVDSLAPGTGLASIVEHELNWLSDMNTQLNNSTLSAKQRSENHNAFIVQRDAARDAESLRLTREGNRAFMRGKYNSQFPGIENQTTSGVYLPNMEPHTTKPFSAEGIPNATRLVQEKAEEVFNASVYGKAYKQFRKMFSKALNSGEVSEQEVELAYQRARATT